jgi:N-acetylglucosamine malate deacetylase 1
MPKTILMLAMYGLEIVEVGGTLALHTAQGDRVAAAVMLARPESRAPLTAAAAILGVEAPQFLEFAIGTIAVDVPSKEILVRLLRTVRPDTLITQDPEHAQHDLDPDRRPAMTLFQEAVALAGRDWRIAECGTLAPHTVRDWYYMTPTRPNCVIEIGTTFARKQQALAVLDYQLRYSAQVQRARLGDDVLRSVVPDYDAVRDDDLALGLALHRAMDLALAMGNGLLNHHAHAALGEAFRHEGPFTFNALP